jgi:hypothetical protein
VTGCKHSDTGPRSTRRLTSDVNSIVGTEQVIDDNQNNKQLCVLDYFLLVDIITISFLPQKKML